MSMGAIGIPASQRHCRILWQCQMLTALVMATVHYRFGSARVIAVCVMSFVAPLFPPRRERLRDLGSVLEHGHGFRACIKLSQTVQHIGPQRDTEPEARIDLDEMRNAASRAHVGLVAERLRADAATRRDLREATQGAEAPPWADAATQERSGVESEMPSFEGSSSEPSHACFTGGGQ